MSEGLVPQGKAFIVPDWLLDAWQSGINHYSGKSRDYLIKEIQSRLDKGTPSAGSWDFWHLASIMALLGWQEVKRASESHREADREEVNRDPAGA